MNGKKMFSFVLAMLLISSQPFLMFSSANNNLSSSDTGSVGNADNFYTASGSVDGHVGFTAFLSASGIYLSADLDTFADVQISLDNLYEDFKQDVSGVAQSLGELGGSIVRGGLAFSRKSWNGYKKFADWLVSKFNITDNSNDVALDDIPVSSSNEFGFNIPSYIGDGYIFSQSGNNFNLYFRLYNNYFGSGVYFYYIKIPTNDYYILGLINLSSESYENPSLSYRAGTGPDRIEASGSIRLLSGGHSYITGDVLRVYSPVSGIPVVNSLNAIPDLDGGGSDAPSSGLSVSTKNVDIPDEIPDGGEGGENLGGLVIPAVGAGLGGAAGAIAGNIMQGVLDGVMPDIDIRPADVKVPPGMEIDDDGNVFPSDVEFRPTDVFLDSDAYKLDMLTNYFPFSIPWDLLHFAAMFRAEPEIPILDFVIPMPDGIDDITIHIDLTPFDSVATLSRSGIFVLFAIRWLMFLYRKFG